MISVCEGYNSVKLEKDQNRDIYYLFNDIRVQLLPEETKLIKLPYKRLSLSDNKYYNIQLSKKLIMAGLDLKWVNLNEIESLTCIELLVSNLNTMSELNRSDITMVLGSGKKININSGELLCSVYCVDFEKICEK